MVVTLRALETAVPPTILVQDEVREVFATQPDLSRLAQRLVSTSFSVSGIDTRHTVIEELTLAADADDHEPVFFDRASRRLLMPGTKARNELYTSEATKLYVEAARRTLGSCEGVVAADVTHVITVSCTGFYAPGPDYMLVRELGLNPATQRFHLGFMGCYASMPALRLAAQLVNASADAVVLVVSAELCTLHLRSSSDPDTIVASSLFADGAAACIVSSRLPVAGEVALELDHFETIITPVGEGDMAWKIGDQGFEMVLSTYVPHIIDEHIEQALKPLIARDERLRESGSEASHGRGGVGADAAVPLSESIAHWAIHPGGRSILDKTEAKFGLNESQLVPSRETLRRYGNMSSATVLFVLRHILASEGAASGDRVCAMAFGPGLTVESGLMTVRVGE